LTYVGNSFNDFPSLTFWKYAGRAPGVPCLGSVPA